MATPRFTMVVLLVEDLARSVAFYRRLGVEFPPDVEARRDVVVDIGDAHKLVLTTTFARNVPGRVPPSGGARTFLEFFVDGDAAVDALYAEPTAAGHAGRRPPFRTDFGAWMAMVDDPDGNTVLVTAGRRLATSRIVREPGQERRRTGPRRARSWRSRPMPGRRPSAFPGRSAREVLRRRLASRARTRASMSAAVIPRAVSLAPGLQKQPVRTEILRSAARRLDAPEVDDAAVPTSTLNGIVPPPRRRPTGRTGGSSGAPSRWRRSAMRPAGASA